MRGQWDALARLWGCGQKAIEGAKIFRNESDRAWVRFGRVDPYFGVKSDDRFRNANNAGPERDEFFASGEVRVRHTLSQIREALAPAFAPRRAMDFGCGVGRIVIPLARQVDEVVGVDVSPGMLEEARRNCEDAGVGNVALVQSDDELSRVPGSFDFVHSYIVLQHIPPKRGEKIIQVLAEKLTVGGVAALHVVFSTTQPRWRAVVSDVRTRLPLLHSLINVLRGRAFTYPLMQMNTYNLNHLFEIIRASGCPQIVCEFTDHRGYIGVMMYFRKDA